MRLSVVPVEGLKREMQWEATGLAWRAPSPNLRTAHAAYAYPAFGLFEGIEVSEGRGTEETFEKVGAPFIEEESFAEALRARHWPGVVFRPTRFFPRTLSAAPRPRMLHQLCRGVAVEVVDPGRFEPVRTGLGAIETVRSLYPGSFRWVSRGDQFWIDFLLGTDRPRRALESGMRADDVLAESRAAVTRFLDRRRPHLLY